MTTNTLDAADHADATGRGRQADKPWQIPLSGWKDVLLRARQEMVRDHVTLIAAGCAFYALLAVFPGIAAAISLWGLFAEPSEIVRQIDGFTAALPPEAAGIIHEQAAAAAAADKGALLTALFGIALGIFSASKGINSLIEGLNIVYDETEQRGFLKKTLLNLGLTFASVIGLLLAAILVVAVPAALGQMGLGAGSRILVTIVQWTVLILGAGAAFAMLYRIAPNRTGARWEWLSGGGLLAVLVWVLGSALFSFYVARFASYNATYGALGGVVILLMWLYMTAVVILLGAEVNAELERQTKRDTTTGKRRPMGERGAFAADTLGKAMGKKGRAEEETTADDDAPHGLKGGGRA